MLFVPVARQKKWGHTRFVGEFKGVGGIGRRPGVSRGLSLGKLKFIAVCGGEVKRGTCMHICMYVGLSRLIG